jgi:uncharacterized protein
LYFSLFVGTKNVKISFDPRKSQTNADRRGLPFTLAEDFDWASALIVEDRRSAYSEQRFQALGLIAGVLHMLVYCIVADGIRVISLRRASRRERKGYGRQETEPRLDR